MTDKESEMNLIRELDSSIEHDTKKLQALAIAADRILRDELERSSLEYDFAEVRIIDRKTVGVQGDQRTYAHPVMIEIRYRDKIVHDEEFKDRLSNRITNEVSGINRVTYTLATREKE